MNGPSHPQFWPHEHQDIIDFLPEDHWFKQNYHRLTRTPTRQELFSFYMPLGIIESRPEILAQRLQEALAFILRATVEEEEEEINEAPIIAHDESATRAIRTIGRVQAEPARLQDEEGELALIYYRSKNKAHVLTYCNSDVWFSSHCI